MKNGKRGSLLDVFIVLMIVFGVVGIFLRVRMLHIADGDGETVAAVTLTVENFHTRGLVCLSEGETLYTAGGEAFGVVEEITHTPTEVSLVSDGVLYTGAPEDTTRVCLFVRVISDGRVQDGVFLRDGKYAVMAGERVTLYGERSELHFMIRQVEMS